MSRGFSRRRSQTLSFPACRSSRWSPCLRSRSGLANSTSQAEIWQGAACVRTFRKGASRSGRRSTRGITARRAICSPAMGWSEDFELSTPSSWRLRSDCESSELFPFSSRRISGSAQRRRTADSRQSIPPTQGRSSFNPACLRGAGRTTTLSSPSSVSRSSSQRSSACDPPILCPIPRRDVPTGPS